MIRGDVPAAVQTHTIAGHLAMASIGMPSEKTAAPVIVPVMSLMKTNYGEHGMNSKNGPDLMPEEPVLTQKEAGDGRTH